MEDIQTHNHDGVNSQKISSRNVIPTYYFTTTELASYLARPAVDGDEFNCFDGTNYYKYLRINNSWVEVGGSLKVAIGTEQAPESTGNVVISTGFRPKLIRITLSTTLGDYTGMSIGSCSSASNSRAVYSYSDGDSIRCGYTDSFILVGPIDTGGSSKCAATVNAIGDTSFTINFQNVTVRPNYYWEAIG